MPLGMEIGFGPGNIVLDRDPAPSLSLPQKGAQPPNFRPMSIVSKRLYVSGYNLVRTTEVVGLSLGDTVLGKDPCSSPPLKGHSLPPIFGQCLCCSQTAGWTKTPLGTEIGLGPGDFVIDGDPAPL